ncbi:MAG: hypothetical protein OHK0048_06140 [Rhodoferax sp.]
MIIVAMLPDTDFTPVRPILLRLVTFSLGLVVGASALYWLLRWPHAQQPRAAQSVSLDAPAIDGAAVTRLLAGPVNPGSAATAPALPTTTLQLKGVIAEGGRGTGVALIAAQAGAPAKPYRVGQAVDASWVLHKVLTQQVELARTNDATVRTLLTLPSPDSASRP